MEICVFEKEEGTFDNSKNITKDGFHVYICYGIMSVEKRFWIRHELIREL